MKNDAGDTISSIPAHDPTYGGDAVERGGVGRTGGGGQDGGGGEGELHR